MVCRNFWRKNGVERWLWTGLGLVMIAGLVTPRAVFAAGAESAHLVTAAYVEGTAVAGVMGGEPTKNLAADALIRITAETLVADIRQNRDLYATDPSDLYAKVRDWVFPHFDFPRISRYVLGDVWENADREVQERFSAEFSTLMLHTYGSALLAFQDEQIEYLPFVAKPDATMVTVKTQLRRADGKVAPVDYRMGNQTGQWKVLDVKIDGVSLVKTYRSEYGSIVKREGVDSLIEALKKRNHSNS